MKTISILIKDFDMPTKCGSCRFLYKGVISNVLPLCLAGGFLTEEKESRDARCPIVEVPDDVQPVKHGYWKYETDYCLVCSECGNPAEINGITGEFMESPYCSECGARMDGET